MKFLYDKIQKKRKTKTFNVKFIFENEFINIIIQNKTKQRCL